MNIVIVEDEPRIARRVERFTREILAGQIKSLQVFGELQDAQRYLDAHHVDLLLLDLNLHGQDGFSILKPLLAAPFYTIIISAYTDRALEAFEYGVLDFVPKPFNRERLEKALLRTAAPESEKAETSLKHLAVIKTKSVVLIDIDKIVYIKGAGPYSEIHLRNEQVELHNKNLNKLAVLLSQNFERIHKSYLVNTGEISSFRIFSGSRYELLLQNGSILPVGRTYYKKLKGKWK